MPVERSKALKRSASAGNEFVWASTAEPLPMPTTPPTGTEVSFAMSMSLAPWSFDSNTPPPLVDNVPEFIMFPPPDDCAGSPAGTAGTTTGGTGAPAKRQPHSKKKPINHIPRPPNAFILFRSAFVKSQHVSTAVETNHSTLSKIIGIAWQKISEEERQVWHEKAKLELEEHKRKFPKYAFKPVQTKAKGGGGGGPGGGGNGNGRGGGQTEKRKVREVEPKDIKRCAKIAQLIVDGSKGDELIAAVEEFDKHHVPEIVTRFEAPITAHAFRRASSVPVEETEGKGKTFLQKGAGAGAGAGKRKRCVSTKRPAATVPVDVLLPEFTSISGSNAAYSTLDSQAILPLKEEPLLSFGNFSFDNIISRPTSAFACDPLTGTPGLEIDTCDWSSPPSPASPSSPTSYMMSPSPMPATPTYSGNFEHELDAAFGQFAASEFPNMCGGGVDSTISGGIPLMDIDCVGIYSPYDSVPAHHHLQPYHTQYTHHSLHAHQQQQQQQQQHQQQASPLGYFDFDFSSFVDPMTQYAM